MNIDLNDAIVRLSPDNNFQMRDARGTCVHVHWGDLWITQEGDQKDYIVKSGESFAISSSGMTLLAALGEAGVSVMEKCRETAIASTAYIGTIVGSVTPDATDTGTTKLDDSVDESSPGHTQLTDLLPGVGEIDQHIARAELLRARYFADTARKLTDSVIRFWRTLRHSVGVFREFG